eukprot:NODE_130_length_18488_cov_0.389961.p11 type:complete len:149 gc:universal NODE_130_length_18488_cov_0.389961:14615-14169(-)
MMRVRYLYGCNPSGCIDVMISLLRFSIMFFSSALSSFSGSSPPLPMHTMKLWYLLACASIFFCLCKSLCCTIALGCRCPIHILPVFLDIHPTRLSCPQLDVDRYVRHVYLFAILYDLAVPRIAFQQMLINLVLCVWSIELELYQQGCE